MRYMIICVFVVGACMDESDQQADDSARGQALHEDPCLGVNCGVGTHCVYDAADGETRCEAGCDDIGDCVPETIVCGPDGNLHRYTVAECTEGSHACHYTGGEVYQICGEGCEEFGNDDHADVCVNGDVPDFVEPRNYWECAPDTRRCRGYYVQICRSSQAGASTWHDLKECDSPCVMDGQAAHCPPSEPELDGSIACNMDDDCPNPEQPICFACDEGEEYGCLSIPGTHQCIQHECVRVDWGWGSCIYGSCVEATEDEPAHCPPPKPQARPEVCNGVDDDHDGEVDNLEGIVCISCGEGCAPGGHVFCREDEDGTAYALTVERDGQCVNDVCYATSVRRYCEQGQECVNEVGCVQPEPEPDVCEDMDCSPFEGIYCVDGGLLYFAQTGECRNGTCERIWDVLVEECPDFRCDDNESFGVCRSLVDWDNDGWAPDEGDCDDGDDLVYPGDGALVNCVPCSEPDRECPHNGTIMCRDGVLHGVGYTGVCLHEYGDVPYVCEPQHEVIRECEFGCADERSCADPPQ